MSIFEAGMLLCFGMAWPTSIIKSYRTRKNDGKSVLFLWIVFVGYISGITHKLLYSRNFVLYMYVLNSIMVLTDIVLFYRNEYTNGKKQPKSLTR